VESACFYNIIFIPHYQSRFGVAAESPTVAWRTVSPMIDLDNILCKRFTRKLANDNTISVNGTVLQLEPSHGRAHFIKARVWVNQWIDGSYHVFRPTCGELTVTRPGKRSVLPQKRARSEHSKLKTGKRSESVLLAMS